MMDDERLAQIVAALAALDQILTVNGPYEPVVDEVEGGHGGPYYMFCHGRTAHEHRDSCPWNAAILATYPSDVEELTR